MGENKKENTGFQRSSIADALFETNYQPNLSQELWLNLGGKEYRLIGKSIRIGRALDNDIVVEDKSCSRYHAMISISDGSIHIEDLKSRNGVTVNGYPLKTKHSLEDNDELEIGDLKGVFFQREKAKKQKQKAAKSETSQNQEDSETSLFLRLKQLFTTQLWDRFRALPKALKLGSIAMAPLFIFVMLMVFSGSASSTQTKTASSAPKVNGIKVSQDDIVSGKLDREKFDHCIELEDLGIYQKARSCLQSLPLTAEVFAALKRVSTTQTKLSKTRFEEGLKAYNNYYYDLAIIKWQEVLLISQKDSELAQRSRELIQNAKRSQKSL